MPNVGSPSRGRRGRGGHVALGKNGSGKTLLYLALASAASRVAGVGGVLITRRGDDDDDDRNDDDYCDWDDDSDTLPFLRSGELTMMQGGVDSSSQK